MGDHSNGQLFPEEDMPLRASSAQQILPLFRPQELADQLGLNWWAVLKLRDDGWLSFDPEKEQITDDGMEAEFVFLGSLVSAGCDPRMLAALLEGLEKPYRYHIGGVYYDWRTREWRGLPREREPEEVFADWLSELTESGDIDTLRSILSDVETALEEVGDDAEDDDES